MAEMFTFEGARWYVAGMFDGEGSVGNTTTDTAARGVRPNRNIRIGGCEKDIIDLTATALDLLEIPYRYYTQRTRAGTPFYLVQVHTREGFLRFYEVVPFRFERKRKALEAIVEEVRTVRPKGRRPSGVTNKTRPCECERGHKNLAVCRSTAWSRERRTTVIRNAEVGKPIEIVEIPQQVPAEPVPVKEPVPV